MLVARQPIFNKSMKIYGYELLFRANQESNIFSDATATSATALVIGDLFEQGVSKMIGDAKAFVNFDYEFIMSDAIELIDPETLVIEVLETVEVDEDLLVRIKELKNKGYRIALDDFEEDYSTFCAVSVADIIKYDILSTPLDTIMEEAKKAISDNKILLAEKIETEEEFQVAKSMGFQLFQGYFFSKPKIIEKRKKRNASKAAYTQILNEIRSEEFSFETVARMIESDIDLSYRLLGILSKKNSNTSFDSIRKALVRMGKKEIERWIYVLMMQNMAKNKPDEILRMSLVRSQFGKIIAERTSFSHRKEEVSMMCLFSMLDVVLDCTMEEALDELPLSEAVSQGLIKQKGIFQPLINLMIAYEKGDWTNVDRYSRDLDVDTHELSDWYIAAIQWSNSVMGS